VNATQETGLMMDKSPPQRSASIQGRRTQQPDLAEFEAHQLLATDSLTVWDVVCPGTCRQESAEEAADTTHLVFPYQGVYVQHVGRSLSVAEPNAVVVINDDEPYRVSHPVEGGDSCLSIWVDTETLLELAPSDYLRAPGRATFNRPRLPIDPQTQSLAALLRHKLNNESFERLDVETLTLTLLRRTLGERSSPTARSSVGRQKLVDLAKLVVSSDLGRRWTLAEIAAHIAVSPVYLTHLFQQVEGTPLYRYQLQLRLARALDLLKDYENVTDLAFDLGFSSHSHFSAAFKQTYGQTPSAFRQAARI
jgi:AraC family transcriptional regulator